MVVNAETTTRKLVSMPNSMVQAIDDFRFRARLKTESEAIRRLIELGLGAATDKPTPTPTPPAAQMKITTDGTT